MNAVSIDQHVNRTDKLPGRAPERRLSAAPRDCVYWPVRWTA
jgi:hypothetical protein